MRGPELETERMVLRPLEVDDVDLLVALDADPEVMRFITGGRPSERADVEDLVAKVLGFRWIALDRTTGEVLGWFGLKRTNAHERELGYRLRRSAWGRGLATEGARAMVDLAFSDPAIERVWADTMAVNLGSRRVLEKAGLTFVRTYHGDWPDVIAGSEHGDVIYELRRP